ncbi:MAG TPA: hypothetical protein VNC50_18410, partial [Planctomycetia bacterium]|nr:hypothetical protein [Planctomycetia bacterium]
QDQDPAALAALAAEKDRQEAQRTELAAREEQLETVRRDLAKARADQERRAAELDRLAAELVARQTEATDGAERIEVERAKLDAERAEVERKTAHLEARFERMARLQTAEAAKRRRRRGALAEIIAKLERKDGEQEHRSRQLEDRESRWHELEREVRTRQRLLAEQAERVALRLAGLETELKQIHAEREACARDWDRLRDERAEFEKLQAGFAARIERLAADEAELKSLRQTLVAEASAVAAERDAVAAEAQSLDRKSTQLRGRERETERRESVAAAKERENGRRTAQLAAQAEELADRAHDLQARIDAERAEIERDRKLVENEALRQAAARDVFKTEQQGWQLRRAELLKDREALDRQASLLAARERNLAETQLAHAAAEREAERRDLALQQRALERAAAAAAESEARLEGEARRLAAHAADLEIRQQNLLERERRIAEDAVRRGRELEADAAALAARRAEFDAEARAQQEAKGKLKAAGIRFAARKKAILEKVEDFDRKLAEAQADLAQAHEAQRRLREDFAKYCDAMRRRETTALAWLREVRKETEALAGAQGELDHQVRAAALGSLAVDPEELHKSLGDWTARLRRLQRRLAEGETVLGGARAAEAEPRLRAATIAASPDWVPLLVQHRLADEEVLRWLLQNAERGGPPLERALVDEGIVTRYQLDCIRAGRPEDLEIGPARVLDAVHRGKSADVLRIALSGHDRPLALRLLHPRFGAPPALRPQFEAATKPWLAFRHPHVAPLRGAFLAGERIGMLSDYVQGRKLASFGAARWTPGMAIRLALQGASVFASMQKAGLAHRGLRPGRVLVATGERLVLLGAGEPPGVQRLERAQAGPSGEYYVSPEELLVEGPVDVRADLFAFGRILSEAISGRRLRFNERLDLPPSFPRGLAIVLRRMMEPSPESRCRSLSEIVAALENLAADLPEGDETLPLFRSAA